jgi:uncharacterized protein (DUF2267 family)/iron-sulfur cluster repair protein YtfE (RIC family)
MIAIASTRKEKPWGTWHDLIAYIVEAYHDSMRAALPRLEGLADQVARERCVSIHVLDSLLREFSALADSLRTHLLQQEGHLFPMIRHVCESVEQAGWACHLQDSLEELMDEATRADREAVASVKRAEDCFRGTDWAHREPLVGKLVKGLRELRQDLEEHVQLETHVLFPVVRALLRGDRQAMERLLAMRDSEPPLDSSADASPSHRWFEQVMEEMGYRDQPRACRAMKSVLHALRDHLSGEKAIALGAQLPKQIRRLYYEDWQNRWDRNTTTQKKDFLREIAEPLKDEPDRNPEKIARSVFRILARQITSHEAESVRRSLPGEIRSLWPSEDATTSMAELIVADQETG